MRGLTPEHAAPAEGSGPVRVDNGDPVDGTHTIAVERVDVSTNLPDSDPNWSTVDRAGHFHAASAEKRGVTYPTLLEQSRHRDCDGRCGGAPDFCEGWTEVWRECRICSEVVRPGTIPGPHYRSMPGMTSWEVVVPLRLEHGDKVSVRFTRDGVERFGVAQAIGGWDWFMGAPKSRLVGISPLGTRRTA